MMSGTASAASLLSENSDELMDHRGSQATLSTAASDASLTRARMHRKGSDFNLLHVESLGIEHEAPQIHIHERDLLEPEPEENTSDFPGARHRRSSGAALTARGLGGSGRPKTSIVASRPQTMPGQLGNFNRYFGDMFNGEDGGSKVDVGELPKIDDSVIQQSKQFLQNENRRASGMQPRPPGRPQTQGQARAPPRRGSLEVEAPMTQTLTAEEDVEKWFPTKASGGVSALPIQALLRKS